MLYIHAYIYAHIRITTYIHYSIVLSTVENMPAMPEQKHVAACHRRMPAIGSRGH